MKQAVTRFFLVSLLCAGIYGCATVPSPQTAEETIEISYKEILLDDLCAFYNVSWSWDGIGQIITLEYKGQVIKFMVGSEVVLSSGQPIKLSAPVQIVKSRIIMPVDFEQKVLLPLVRPYQETIDAQVVPLVRTVVLDAGHGGKDTGAIGFSGVREKDVVLDITRRLGKILSQNGFEIHYTRENDVFVSLEKRTEIASRVAHADLFVSIHANSARARNAYGLEVFSLKDLDYAGHSEVQRRTNHRKLFGQLAMKKNSFELDRIVESLLYENKQKQSAVLAEKMARNVSRFVQTKNRGEKDSRFFVLRNTLVPAVLMEVGFLSNAKEERLLRSSAYRQKVAYAIAQSIIEYGYSL